jgi:hypothetical protein
METWWRGNVVAWKRGGVDSLIRGQQKLGALKNSLEQPQRHVKSLNKLDFQQPYNL